MKKGRNVNPDFFHRKAYQVFWGEHSIYRGSITLLLSVIQLIEEEDEERNEKNNISIAFP